MTRLLITQVRSGIGGTRNQRETLRTLGLRRIGATVVREDRPEVLGMIATVPHLVRVDSVDDGAAPAGGVAQRESSA